MNRHLSPSLKLWAQNKNVEAAREQHMRGKAKLLAVWADPSRRLSPHHQRFRSGGEGARARETETETERQRDTVGRAQACGRGHEFGVYVYCRMRSLTIECVLLL